MTIYSLPAQLQAVRLRLQFFRSLTEDAIQAEVKRLGELGGATWPRVSWFLSLTPHGIRTEIATLSARERELLAATYA